MRFRRLYELGQNRLVIVAKMFFLGLGVRGDVEVKKVNVGLRGRSGGDVTCSELLISIVL